MNRRTFLSGLLALPVIGPALAKGLGSKPVLFRPGTKELLPLHPSFSDIIASTIELRSQRIADNVHANNPLLKHMDRLWSANRAFAVGDEVEMGHRVLVCVAAGSTTWRHIEDAQPHHNTPYAGALVSTYIVDNCAFDEDHSRTLIRRMRREAHWHQWNQRPAWPFDNSPDRRL